jgi:hypothetical protein
MLRQGRFPLGVHAAIEYLAGVLFIAAPFLFGFDSSAAKAVSIVVGVVILAIAASTDWRPAVMRSIPVPFHLALDLVLVALLVASPFIFGFSGDSGATAFFIVLGVAHLLLTLGTRFTTAAPAAAEPALSEPDAEQRWDRDQVADPGTTVGAVPPVARD